ncbi:MAG: cytochrome c3 family protein [Anaerolineales bacterium]|nr:cytochrome c3 family protein [Anaerolineales bacterium]
MPKKQISKSKRKTKPILKILDGRMKFIAWGAAAIVMLIVSSMFVGTQLENHDSFCASCHTEGETTFYKRSLAADKPVDLASFHTAKAARCIDCHSGGGITGRIGGLMTGATDTFSYLFTKYPQPAVMEEPFGDGNCLKCHANIAQKQDMNNHFHVFLPKWQAADKNAATCVSCHNGHNTNGSVAIQYLNEKDTVAVCQKCHAVAGEG